MQKKQLFTTQDLVKVALLSAIAIVLQLFEIVIPIFPEFYKVDFSDLPAIIAAIIINPLAGVFVELIKNLIHMLRTSSGFIGEFANFVIGVSLVVPVGIYCKKDKSFKNFVKGAVLGVITMAVVAAILNATVLLPMYAKLFGSDVMDFVAMSTAIFPFIDTYTKFILLTVVPFNLIKGTIVMIVAGVMYKFLMKSTYVSNNSNATKNSVQLDK